MHPHSLSPSPAVLGLDTESLSLYTEPHSRRPARDKAGPSGPAGLCRWRRQCVMLRTLGQGRLFLTGVSKLGGHQKGVL